MDAKSNSELTSSSLFPFDDLGERADFLFLLFEERRAEPRGQARAPYITRGRRNKQM